MNTNLKCDKEPEGLNVKQIKRLRVKNHGKNTQQLRILLKLKLTLNLCTDIISTSLKIH